MPTDFLPAYGPHEVAILGLAQVILSFTFTLVALYALSRFLFWVFSIALDPYPRGHASIQPSGSAALVTCKFFGGGHCTTRGELVDGLCLNHQAAPEPVLCPRPTCVRPRRAGGILCEPCSKLKSFDADRAPVDVMGSPLDWILEGEARAEAEWKREGGAGHDAH